MRRNCYEQTTKMSAVISLMPRWLDGETLLIHNPALCDRPIPALCPTGPNSCWTQIN